MNTKRMLSFLLAAVMTATSIPMAATAVSAEAAAPNLLEGVAPTGEVTDIARKDTDNTDLEAAESNSFLHVGNRAYKTNDGFSIDFAPVEGVTEYYINADVRVSPDADPAPFKSWRGGKIGLRMYQGTTKTEVTQIKSGNGTIMLPSDGTWVSLSAAEYSGALGDGIKFTHNGTSPRIHFIKGTWDNDPVSFDIDNIDIYWLDSDGTKKSISGYPLTFEGISELPSNVHVYKKTNDVIVRIETEEGYSRISDLKAETAGTYNFLEALKPGKYSFSGEWRKGYFNTAADWVNTDTVKVTAADAELASFDITPDWADVDVEFEIFTDSVRSIDISAVTFDTAVDFRNVKLTLIEEYDISVDESNVPIASVSGTESQKAEKAGNKYLYVTNKDPGALEGIKVEITPVANVSTYYVKMNMRGTNLVDSKNMATRFSALTNCSVNDSTGYPWGEDYSASWDWDGILTKDTVGTLKGAYKVVPTDTSSTFSFVFGINGGLGDSDNTLDIDDLVVYYLNSAGSPVEIARFDFEDARLVKNGVSISGYDEPRSKNKQGELTLSVIAESDYLRIKDLSDEASGILGFDKALAAGDYLLRGEFRMAYYQRTANGKSYVDGMHTAIVTATDSSGKTLGTVNITPNWTDYELPITLDIPSETLKLTVTQNGITDETEYKNTVDMRGLKLTIVELAPVVDVDVEAFIAAVNSIGTVTLDSGDKIAAAEAAYAILTSDEQIVAVAEYKAALDAAKVTYNELVSADKQAAEDAAEVQALIDAIPALDKLTAGDEAAVKAARDAYNELSDAASAKISAESAKKIADSLAKIAEIKNYEPDPVDRDPDDGIKSISGTSTVKSEISGNKYLYITGKDWAAAEGVKIEITPVENVSTYYVMFSQRATNLNVPGANKATRITQLANCSVKGSTGSPWGVNFTSTWSWDGVLNKKTASELNGVLDVVPTDASEKFSFIYSLNGGTGDGGNTLDIDDLVVFYLNSDGAPVEIARFDFEDGLLEKNGVKLTPGEYSKGTNMYGPLKLEVMEEHYYSRIDDLSAEEAGIVELEETLKPAVYTISGDFRMPYFQITGAKGYYTEGTHSAVITVTDEFGDVLGEFEISPSWKNHRLPVSVLNSTSKLKLTLTESGITDETEYRNTVDVNNLKIELTRSFENTISVEGGITDTLELYTINDYYETKSEDGYLRIYNRGVSGGFEGFGFTTDGITFAKGKTYTISFRARQPFVNDYATTLSAKVAKDGTWYVNDVPATKSSEYAAIYMPNDGKLYAGSYGIAVIEGWNDYEMEFTPKDCDIEDPDIVFFARYFGGNADYYRFPDGTNALNPIDVDYIEISDESGAVIYREDFDGEFPANFSQATSTTLGSGSSKLDVAEDDHMTVENEGGIPEIKLSGFDPTKLLPGKYALSFEARLGYYDSVLKTDGSVASLDMAVANSDGTAASKKTEIGTEWTTVTYSFFVTETNIPSEIKVTLSAVPGGVENLSRFDIRNFEITSQIFEIETEDETSPLNGVEIFSVGDTVKTEVYADDGVTPDGYLHVYDRPNGEYDGAGVKLDKPLVGGEKYIISFKARKSSESEGDICLTVAGNTLSDWFSEYKNQDPVKSTYWAVPIKSQTPAPYGYDIQGVYVKSEWQTYYFEYIPNEDVPEPSFAFVSNYFWMANGNDKVHHNAVRYGEKGLYDLNQNPFDIDDLVIYKVGEEATPIWADDFNAGVSDAYKSADGYSHTSDGKFVYDSGKAKIAFCTDIYESVVNETEAPELNLSGFNTMSAGRYAFSAYVRLGNGYDSSVSFDEQETAALSIVAYHSAVCDDDGADGTTAELERFDIGSEWVKISYIFTIDENTTSMDQVRMILDRTGRFDYRDFELEKLEDETLPPPNPGVVMVYLYKKMIHKVLHPEIYLPEGSQGTDEEVELFNAVDYFKDALSAESADKWQTSGQTLEFGISEDGKGTVKVSGIRNNYQMLTYAAGEHLPAGDYHFKMDLRAANPGEDTKLRINICGQTRNVRLTNEWTSLEFLISTTEAIDLTVSFRGGPLAFYTKDFEIAGLSLLTLDGREIKMNVFDRSDFENESTAMIGWSSSGKVPMTYTWTTETVGEGDAAVTNSFVRVSNRQVNYQQLYLNTGVKIEAGETYTVTYDIRLADEGSSTIRGTAGITGKLNTKLKVGEEGDADPSAPNYNAYGITGKWKTVSSTFVAADTGSLVLGLGGGTNQSMTEDFDIDNVIVLDKVKPTVKIGGNKYAGGEFDDKDTALASWKGQTHEKLGWKGQTFEHITEADGNSYIKISGREANYQAFTLNTGVKVSEGTTYQITYRIRMSEGEEGDSQIRALAGAASTKTYKLKVEGEGADDPSSSSYHAFNIGNTWKTVTCIYVAETDGELGIEFCGGTGTTYVQDIDIDSFEIYEVYVG